MTQLLKLFIFVIGIVISESRHMHSRDSNNIIVPNFMPETGKLENVIFIQEEEFVVNPIEHINTLVPSRFVPLNSAYVFKHKPCEDGYKRDLLGICREVWD